MENEALNAAASAGFLVFGGLGLAFAVSLGLRGVPLLLVTAAVALSGTVLSVFAVIVASVATS